MFGDYLNLDKLVQDVNTLYISFTTALEQNKNSDIIVNYSSLDNIPFSFSFKTWSIPKPLLTQKTLDEKFPLKCKALNNSSISSYLDETCSICCDDLDNIKLHRELLCGHVFHPQCIDEWLINRDNSCPICKKRFDNF